MNNYFNQLSEAFLFVFLLIIGYLTYFYGNISSSVFYSIDGIFLAILLPLVFFLVNQDLNDPITPFDRRVIFDRVIGAHKVLWIIACLIIPALLWKKIQVIQTFNFFILFFYLIGIFNVLTIFIRSYRWISSGRFAYISYRDRNRIEFIHSVAYRQGIDPYEIWHDIFDHWHFVKNYNESKDHLFKVSFIKDYQFIDETLLAIKQYSSCKNNHYASDQLITLLDQNLDSFELRSDSIKKLVNFYLDNFQEMASGSYDLPEGLREYSTLFEHLLKNNFNNIGHFNYTDVIFKSIDNKFRELFNSNKLIGLQYAQYFIRDNYPFLLENFPGNQLNSYPDGWRITAGNLNLNSKKIGDYNLNDFYQFIQKKMFGYFSYYIFSSQHLEDVSDNKQNSFINKSKEQLIVETVLRDADPVTFSKFLLLARFNPESSEFRENIPNLLNKQTKFGIHRMTIFYTKEKQSEIDKQLNTEIFDSYEIIFHMFPYFQDKNKLKGIVKILKEEALKDKSEEQKSKKINIYINFITKLISYLNNKDK